ncbi:uncharacterized protein BO80DRAFT_272559 [Aspergillus ibericus CBS 121593]|uniref:Uncharacterized protein n=1 Tax=Aspergillus ibericus CBS 121593 TaxID=1448316 RepID=A0A395H8E2_9EURO|nr:hypothetical protein BO80DRAFT_272559 [Aspergillus ibericus CBS 121593]RAL03839.1 hypothetical protein BO80DRAFT_272559 [Aspergillus ibericus CBS 121593]
MFPARWLKLKRDRMSQLTGSGRKYTCRTESVVIVLCIPIAPGDLVHGNHDHNLDCVKGKPEMSQPGRDGEKRSNKKQQRAVSVT